MILNAIEGRELPVYGDGLQIRDWLHVQDHCEALLAVIGRGTFGSTYCIGGNDERTNLSVVETICDLSDEELGRRSGSTRALIRHVADRRATTAVTRSTAAGCNASSAGRRAASSTARCPTSCAGTLRIASGSMRSAVANT